MPTNYATKQAANKLHVSPNTLRNWSEQYADYLSESARPGHQPERQFTDMDMTVLEYIKQLRGEGMKEDGIKQRLSETTFTDTEILQPATNVLQRGQSTATQNAPDRQGSMSGDIMASSIINAIDSLQRRVDGLEIQRQEPAVSPEYLDAIQSLVEVIKQSRQTPDELTMDMTRRLEAVEAVNNEARREASAAARDEIRKSQRDMLVVFMAGAITMGVVILIFVAVVWLYGK